MMFFGSIELRLDPWAATKSMSQRRTGSSEGDQLERLVVFQDWGSGRVGAE
jgi:hypothetical protein